MPPILLNLFSNIRFGAALLSAFRDPWNVEKGASSIQQSLENRTGNFLALCDSRIFANRNSPYRKLFDAAGFSRQQLIAGVREQGVEKTLLALAMRGIYLDIDEFKGRKPVTRQGLRMIIESSDLDTVKGPSLPVHSSGSRGPGMKSRIDLPGLHHLSTYIPLMFNFMDAEHLPLILYYPMPSVSGIIHFIIFTMAGKPPSAWFNQTKANTPRWRNRSLWNLRALITCSRPAGISLPSPRFADINRPVVMARWIKDHSPDGAVVSTFTCSALHLVHTAQKEGIRLPSLYFILGGEPVTGKKRRILEEAGHRVFPWYSSVETGRIALGCLSPAHSDDMHLLSDRVAAVIHPRSVGADDTRRPAALFTSLHPDMYKFFLNVETGDEMAMGKRSCGCPWESLGLDRHVHSVQSFEKLTLEGMSIVADIISRFAEEDLPARCGGSPVDYQFTEEEDGLGITRLILSVSPSVSMDSEEIREILLALFSDHVPSYAFLSQASSIRIRREHPALTRSGKILPLRSVKA